MKSPNRVTPREFAALLGKGVNFVFAIIKAGEITVEDVRAPGTRMPRYEIDPAEAERWRRKRRQRVQPESEKKRKPHPLMHGVPEVIH